LKKSEVRSIFFIFFYQDIIILYSEKYCFFILFRHIVNALEHDWKSSRKTENKTLVGSGSGNCFHFTPNGNATSISQHQAQKQNKSHAVAYYKW